MMTEPSRLYTRQFFQIFAALGLFMSGVSLQFHFAQYIDYLGHSVDTLGLLLSISMVATLLIRLQIGRWIDRFGCKFTWLAGTLLAAGSVGLMQFAEQLWVLATLRTLSQVAIAFVITTVSVLAARIAPPGRRAESIGTIGLAGFFGMSVGSSLGDEILSGDAVSAFAYRMFFSASTCFSLMAAMAVLRIRLPANNAPTVPQGGASVANTRPNESMVGLVLRHWPGVILVVAVVFSMAFCLQLTFLERLAEARGFRDIKVFFLVYSPTAMTLRFLFRRVPQRIGRTRSLLGGLLLLSTGLFCLVGIQSQASLVVPAILMGAGHCFVFPSMIDLAAERFPPDRRGTGTSLVLGAGDLGMLIGFAGLGKVIDTYGFDLALEGLAGTVLFGAFLLAWTRRGAVFGRRTQMTSEGVRPSLSE